MLTPEQEKEWARRVAEVTEYVDGGKFSNVEDDTIIAVNLELAALRKQVEKLTTERDNARIYVRCWKRRVDEAAGVVGNLEAQVETQRVALVTARDVLTRLGEEDEYMLAFLYDRETEPVLAAIDTALGKEEET